MEQYQITGECRAEAERMIITLVLNATKEKFDEFADTLADKYAKDNTEDERNKIKEYFRRKVLATDVDSGYIEISPINN